MSHFLLNLKITMNIFRKLRIYVIALTAFAAMFIASNDASAQTFASAVKNYTQSQFAGGYSSIVGQLGTTQLLGAYTYTYSYPYNYKTFALPFDFIFDSTKYLAGSTLYEWGFGKLAFDPTGNTSNYDYGNAMSPSNVTRWPSMIQTRGMCYWSNIGGVYYNVSGLPGTRVLTIQYDNISTYYSGYTNPSVQIKLYEGVNRVEILYQNNNYYIGYGYDGGCGLNGAINNDENAYTTVSGTFQYNGSMYTPPNNLRFQPQQTKNIQLSVQPKSLFYGTVPVGNIVDKQVVIKNTGTFGNLIVSSTTITGNSDFTIVSGTPVPPLAPGQTDTLTIRLVPQTFGTRSAILTVTSNGQDSGTQQVSLIGTGIAANIAVDSLIRFRKTRTRFGDSLTQYVHITSTGQVPLVFTSFPITDIDSDQYFISYYPASVMLPGAVDSLGITYVPTKEGKHVATLKINSNAFNFPTVTISLQGTGILPHIVVTPSLLLFDSTREGDTVCKNITIWNPGTDTLRILKNFLSSNDGDFHYIGLTGSDTAIAPDRTKTVSICFIPLQQGSRQARLLLRTNIVNTFETPRRDTAGIVTVDIRGTGVPFGVFANSISGLPILDSALIGTPVCRMDTLKNNGDADIMVTSLSLAGGVFTQTGLPATPFLLKARSFKVFTLCGTPNVQGLIVGLLTFNGTTGGKTISYAQALGVFGLKSCVSAAPSPLFENVVLPNNGTDSTLCITVTNCGDIAAVYTPTISGNAKTDYSFTPSASGLIQPKGTTTFCVDYKPTAERVSDASFDIASSDKSSVSVPLVGSAGCAVLASTVDQIPNTGAFDTTGFFNVTINNTGKFDWTPGQLNQIIVTPNDKFEVISVTTTGSAPNQSVVIKMRFHSRETGNFAAKVTFPNAGPCGNTVSVDLNGLIITGSVKETASSDGFILNQSYPNPTQGKTNFTYTTPKETEVRITLVDLTGKLIRTLITGRVSQGEHTVNFDASNIPSGTYMYMLESGSTKLVRQIIVTK